MYPNMTLLSMVSRAAESRTTVVNVFYAIPIPLEVTSTSLRLWVKFGRKKDASLSFDDYFMVFATVVAVAECIAGLVYGPPFGLGRHIWDVSHHDQSMFLKGDYIFSHFYDVAIGLTKLSVLAVYYRIFATTRFRTVVLCTSAFIVAWIITMEIVLGFGCRPIRAWWGAAEPGTFTCVDKVKFTYFTNIVNLVADLWIFAMPIPVITRLNANRDKRMSLLFLFSIGLGTCALSAARLAYVFGVAAVDFTWDEAPLGILSAWEPCGGILCANLPVIYRPLLGVFRRFRSTMHASRSRTHQRQQSHSLEPSSRSGNNLIHHQWNGSNAGLTDLDDGTGVVSEVHSNPKGDNGTELGHFQPSDGIVMETTFRLQSQQEDRPAPKA